MYCQADANTHLSVTLLLNLPNVEYSVNGVFTKNANCYLEISSKSNRAKIRGVGQALDTEQNGNTHDYRHVNVTLCQRRSFAEMTQEADHLH